MIVMIRVLFISILFLFSLTNSQSLMVYGNGLYYRTQFSQVEIKRIDISSIFQGYTIVDSNEIFLAYQHELSAEASTDICIYEINDNKEKFLCEIGGTGESIFDYNKSNNKVVFNWIKGLYTFELPVGSYDQYQKWKFSPTLIFECKQCYAPFWIDSNTVSYQEYINDHFETKIITIK